jgi:hypothetical protein
MMRTMAAITLAAACAYTTNDGGLRNAALEMRPSLPLPVQKV